MKNLRESFNSNKSKVLLTLAVIGLTNSALIENLNAQNPNTSTNPKMEQVDRSDTQRVVDFVKPLGVTIPSEWTQYASNIIQMLDADGIASAQMILQQDLPKVAQADKPAYILMSLEAIRTAYDKEKHTKASDEFFAEYITYENEVKSVTNRFAQDRQKRSEIFIAQTQQEINQNKKEIAQNEEIANQKAKEAEELMLKTYRIAPNDKKLKELAIGTKQIFDKYGYKYSSQTAELFIKLGIK